MKIAFLRSTEKNKFPLKSPDPLDCMSVEAALLSHSACDRLSTSEKQEPQLLAPAACRRQHVLNRAVWVFQKQNREQAETSLPSSGSLNCPLVSVQDSGFTSCLG